MAVFTTMTDAERAVAVKEIAADAKVHISNHSLVCHKISILRDIETNRKEFRELTDEIAMLLTYDATRDLPMRTTTITTGMGVEMETQVLENDDVMLGIILRASLGMMNGMLKLLPNARVGYIGKYRNPDTKAPEEYYLKIPENIGNRDVFVTDPMLATGGSAVATINDLKKRGYRKIHFICVLAAPEGVVALRKAHPDVDIYIGALDEKLDENAYILPGLGDAGDRLYGTK